MSATEPTDRWDADIPLPSPRQNRPTTFSHRVEAGVALGLLSILSRMPIEKASRRMAALMRTIGPMLRPVHARGHANLKLIYPDMTAAERAAILREAWANVGATVGEFAHLDLISSRVEVEGEEILDDFIATNKRAIFISGHFANWEAMSPTLFARGVKFGFVYRAANNPIVDAKIIASRSRVTSRRQTPKSKRGARDLVKMLSEGLSLCMLNDQKLNDGIEVDLLGHPAMTTPAAARLALKNDLPLIPIQISRLPDSRFKMRVHPPIPFDPTGDTRADVEALTTKMNDVLGDFILERPGEWLWFHRRWPRGLTG